MILKKCKILYRRFPFLRISRKNFHKTDKSSNLIYWDYNGHLKKNRYKFEFIEEEEFCYLLISATVRMNTTKFKFIKTKFEMDSNVLKMKKKTFSP